MITDYITGTKGGKNLVQGLKNLSNVSLVVYQ